MQTNLLAALLHAEEVRGSRGGGRTQAALPSGGAAGPRCRPSTCGSVLLPLPPTRIQVLGSHGRHNARLGDDGRQDVAQRRLDPAAGGWVGGWGGGGGAWGGGAVACAVGCTVAHRLAGPQRRTCAYAQNSHPTLCAVSAAAVCCRAVPACPSSQSAPQPAPLPCTLPHIRHPHLSTSPISTSSAAEHSSSPAQALWSRRQASAAIRPPREWPAGRRAGGWKVRGACAQVKARYATKQAPDSAASAWHTGAATHPAAAQAAQPASGAPTSDEEGHASSGGVAGRHVLPRVLAQRQEFVHLEGRRRMLCRLCRYTHPHTTRAGLGLGGEQAACKGASVSGAACRCQYARSASGKQGLTASP